MGTIYLALITTHVIQKYPIKISILQSAKHLDTSGPKMRLGTRKCIGVKLLTPWGYMPGIKWIELIVFSKSSIDPIFGQIFGHQRAENEARNTKMYRGQESHPIGVNARYQMNWAIVFSKKFPETPFLAKYLAIRGPNIRPGSLKWLGVKRLIP